MQVGIWLAENSFKHFAEFLKFYMMRILGRTPYLYRHDLVALSQRNLTQRISKPMNKIPEKYLPKKLAITTRLPETKYAFQPSSLF